MDQPRANPPRPSVPWNLDLVVARVRNVASRHRLGWWALAVAFGLATMWQLSAAWTEAERARDRWGETTWVLVASTNVGAGQEIDPASVRSIVVPRAVVPPSAVASVPDGAHAVRDLAAGEIVVEADLVGSGGLRTGERGVLVPLFGATPTLDPGARVELVGWTDPLLGGSGGASTVADGTVLSIGDGSVTVAIDADEVSAVIEAINLGSVTIVLR